MYNQTRSDFAPWRAAGSDALTALERAYGLTPSGGSGGSLGSAGNTPGASGTQGGVTGSPYGGFFQSPGYQWQLDQGNQAVQRSAAAQGRLGSGATMKAIDRYSQGLAAGDYNTYTANLAQLAGFGQSAVGGTAASGSTAASGVSNALMNAGDAAASSYLNTGSSINSGLNNIMSAYLMRGMFSNGGAGGAAMLGI